jgi:serine protease Do
MRHLLRLCVLLLSASCLFAVDDANIAGIEQVSSTFRNVVKKVKPAVVFIEVFKDSNSVLGTAMHGSGSGVIVDANRGYVLTAYHVVENVSKVHVKLQCGAEYVGTEIRGDDQTDVAIIKINATGPLPQAQLGDSDALEVGDWVLAIGSPFGSVLENSVSAGIVSAKGRRTNVLGRMGIESYIQTDAVINKGNSGGPLVNIRGQVVGINSNIISTTGMYAGLGFAVPSNLIKPVVERLMSEGKVVRGWLGVTIASINEVHGAIPADIVSSGGAFIVDVVTQGPGEKGGLLKGDIILSIDGSGIHDSFELINNVSWKRPGQTAVCEIWRGGQKKTVPVVLGERPASPQPATESVSNETTLKKLGISVADLDIAVAKGKDASHLRAAIITRIDKGSPARQTDIEIGDVVTKIDEQLVESARDFERLMSQADITRGIKLTILNSVGEHNVTVKWPDSAGQN